jgi:hypothetical protein
MDYLRTSLGAFATWTAPIKFAQAVQQSVHMKQQTITRQTFIKFDIGEFM